MTRLGHRYTRAVIKITMKPYYTPVFPKYLSNGSGTGSSEIATATGLFSAKNKDVDLFSSFLFDRIGIIQASIDAVESEIRNRESLRDRLIQEIDLQMCELKGAWHRVAPWENSPITVGDPKRRSAIEKLLADLEAEKRRETTSCWKDVASLQKELRELHRELAEEKRKTQVMSV